MKIIILKVDPSDKVENIKVQIVDREGSFFLVK